MDLDDQFRSVERLLWTLFAERVVAPGGFRIERQRTRKLNRPQLRIERTAHRTVDFGAAAWRDDCQYALTYYGTDKVDVDKVISKVQFYLEQGDVDYSNKYLIQGWRFGWAFPPPIMVSRVGAGTIPAGTYQVRISGTDRCGNESAASVVTPVVTTGLGGLYIQVPRVPMADPYFRQYSIYVNGHLEATVVQPRYGYPEFTLASLLGTGVAPKETVDPSGNLNTVRWRYLRVTGFSSNVQEDMLNNGTWQGVMTLETTVMQPRAQPQTVLMGYISDAVTIGSITGSSTLTVSAGTP